MSLEDIEYNNIKTILSEDEFNQIKLFNKRITKLGNGITEGDDRYKLGIKYIIDIQPIFDKLKSQENQILFDEVIKEEREYLKSEYNITDIDIDYIFDSYYLDYRDRAIISQIYKDAESAGREYLESTENIPKYLEDYMDYEKFGRNLLEDEDYLELEDDRVVHLNY